MKEKLRSLLIQYKTPIRIVLCAFVVILIVLALLTYVPITKTTRYDMRGFIVSADGEIREEFDFTVTCKEYNFIIDPPGGEISFSGERLAVIEEDALILDFEWGLDSINEVCSFTKMIGRAHPDNPRYTYSSVSFYNKKLNQYSFEPFALIDLERGSFCMYAEYLADNAFIVGSTDPRTSPNALIQSYKHHLGDPTIDKLQKIDWTMTGTIVSGSGEVISPCNLSLSGQLALGKNRQDQLNLDIRFPKPFAYWYESSAVYTSQSRKYFNTPYPVFTHYAYNRDADKPAEEPVFSVFAVCPEREYVIFHWEDGKDQYLVASTDPNVPPQEILSYFEAFTEKFVIAD